MYFGSITGNKNENNILSDGPFAYWPVRVNDDYLDTSCNVHNGYGYMRSPIVPLNSPYRILPILQKVFG